MDAKTWMPWALCVLWACSGGAAPEAEQAPAGDEAATSEVAPVSKAALTQFCAFMDGFTPASLGGTDPKQAQQVMAERMREAAKAAGVADWSDFEAWQQSIPPAQRGDALEDVIAHYGLQTECLVMRSPEKLTREERKAQKARLAAKRAAPPDTPLLEVSRDVLAHYCHFFGTLDPKSMTGVPAEEFQVVLGQRLRASAAEADVEGFDAFENLLSTLPPSQRSSALEAAIVKHELRSECWAVRSREAMTEEERAEGVERMRQFADGLELE